MVMIRIGRRLRKAFYRSDARAEDRLTTLAGRSRMIVDRNSYMGGSIYWCGAHHINELLYLKSRVSPDMTFVDAGANQGEISLFVSGLLATGQVIAIEPLSKNVRLLERNIALNAGRNIRVFPAGLSDQPGSLPIYTSLDTAPHSGHHEGLSSLYRSSARDAVEEEVKLVVFDEAIAPEIGRVDFLKIDVEGAELPALRGMEKTLRAWKPEILLEINEETFRAAGYTTADLTAFLFGLGYSVYRIARGRAVKADPASLTRWGNYVFRAQDG